MPWKGGAHIFYIYVELLSFRDIVKSVRLVGWRMGFFQKLLKKMEQNLTGVDINGWHPRGV